MNPRKLIPLVVVLLVLVVLVLLFGRKKPREELRREAGLKRLAPEDFLISRRRLPAGGSKAISTPQVPLKR
jgi:uncharacterized membrane protein